MAAHTLKDRLTVDVRTWGESDIAGLARLAERCGMNVTAARLEHQLRAERDDRHSSTPRFFRRLVAEDGGHVLGTAVGHEDLFLPPGWLATSVLVHPDVRGRGLGSILADSIEEAARPWRPAGFQARVAVDDPGSRHWAEGRGFSFYDDELTCVLKLAGWRPPVIGPLPDGVRIVGLADRDGVVEADVFALLARLVPHAAGTDTDHPLPADSVRRGLQAGGPIVPGATWLARDADGWVGMTLATALGERDVYTLFTGVHPRRWGQGVGTALKCRAIEWARASGAVHTVSHVRSRNTAMLAVNRRLGCAVVADVALLRRRLPP